jgi:hypothetical protein
MRALAEVPAIFLRQGGGGYHPVAAYQLGGWHLINILVLSSLCAESLWPRAQMSVIGGVQVLTSNTNVIGPC